VFARLGAGDMFGQKWLDQTAEESARAVTQVRTRMLRADPARRARHLLAALAKLNVAGARSSVDSSSAESSCSTRRSDGTGFRD
jgi:CRP-like cAMP-binding protein